MQTFAELLTEYMERTGISDSEMARTLGVRRQTIFRWKEGLVERPRRREDVLICAKRLRLTPEERDELLLAAGFAPEQPPPIQEVAPELAQTPTIETTTLTPITPLQSLPESSPIVEPPALPLPRRRSSPGVIVLAAILGVTLAIIAGNQLFLATRSDESAYPVAAPGETLIVVAPIGRAANAPTEIPGQRSLEGIPAVPQNTGERIQAALDREIRAARLERTRVVIWRDEIKNAEAAEQIRQRARAFIMLWGTPITSGSEIRFAVTPASFRVDDLALAALVVAPTDSVINLSDDAAEQAQTVAAFALSQVYLDRGDFGMARAALTTALARPPTDAPSLASLNFYLGYAHQVSAPPDLEQAIQFYTQTIDLAPDMPMPHLNRGVARVRQNQAAQWQTDFARALALQPDSVLVRRALCWAHALDKQPALALPHCDEAVKRDPTARSREARAVVHAELGRMTEAAADLQIFGDWLAKQPENLRARYGSSRAEWLQALQAGKNPIDDAALEKLRRE